MVKSYDVLMMFKNMIVNHYYNLSDHQVQYQKMIHNLFRLEQVSRLEIK